MRNTPSQQTKISYESNGEGSDRRAYGGRPWASKLAPHHRTSSFGNYWNHCRILARSRTAGTI